MEYAEKNHGAWRFKPRLIIHGGAGNILRDKVSPEKYEAYRHALLTIVSFLILIRRPGAV
jgi:L-asparaginase